MKWMRMIVMAIVMCIGSFAGFTSTGAAGEFDSLFLSAEAGVDGYYKESKWTQIKVSVTNKGRDLNGVVRVSSKNPSAEIYEKQISVEAGQSNTVTLEVPGFLLSRGTSVTLLQDGKEIKELALKRDVMTGTLVATIGDSNLFSFFSQQTAPNTGMTVVRPINGSDIVSSVGLDSIDVIVINNFSSSSLQAKQVEAIRKWVELGGTLVIGANPERIGELESIKELLPLTSGGQLKANLKAFNRFAKGPVLTGELPVANGQLVEGKVLFRDGEIPLIAAKELGTGRVIQTAYDLNAEPLASWKGNTEFWRDILTLNTTNFGKGIQHEPGGWALINASQYLPQLKLASIGTIGVLFILYLLVAGPGIYLLLRRKDKREWGWVVLPSLAILLTGSILIAGYGTRGTGTFNQAAGIVEIVRPDFAKVEAAHSFVVTAGGNYNVESIEDAYLQPFGHGSRDNSDVQVLTENGKHLIKFQNVDYMTIRSAVTKGAIRDPGSIEGKMSVKNSAITGTITNKSRFNLHDVRLLIGSRVLLLQDLPIGTSQEIQIPLGDQSVYKGIGEKQPVYRELLPVGVDLNGFNHRYFELLNYNTSLNPFKSGSITIAGWSEDPLDMVTIKEQTNNRGALYLVRQELSVNFAAGETLTLPEELLDTRIPDHTGIIDQGPARFPVVRNGYVTYEFQIPSAVNLQIKKVQIKFDHPELKNFQKNIYNWKTSQWDKVKEDNLLELQGDQINSYLNNRNRFQIQLVNPTSNHLMAPTPFIMVEGEVTS